MIELLVRYCLRFFHIKVPILVSVLLVLVVFGCRENPEFSGPAGDTDYTLDNASSVISLPGELAEISGMWVLPDGSILANEDESGTVYQLNPTSGQISREWKLAGEGDFEDLAVTDTTVYLLLSNGHILRVRGWMRPAPKVDTLKADVPRKCDAEGLALEPGGKRLMIGCKEDAGKKIKNAQAIFALTLDSLQTSVAYVIPYDSLYAVAYPKKPRSIEDKASRLLYGDLELDNFKPSAIAYHPGTGELYVLSSGHKAKSIAVLGRDGRIARVLRLPDDLFPQPEGLAFSRTGEMYISNEGRTGDPTLYRYPYHAHQTVTTE